MQLQSLEDTKNFSSKISKIIGDSDVIFLYGEIGAGKTTFVRFLINHLESKNGIKKPRRIGIKHKIIASIAFRLFRIILL